MSNEKKVREFEIGDIYDVELSKKDDVTKKNTLESLAIIINKESYTKQLSKKEIIEKRKHLSDVSIIIDDLETEKKEIINEFKEKLKKPLEDKKELLQAIRFKSETRTGNLYYIDDQENGFMYLFDENAICIESRPLKPTERQTKIRLLNNEKTA